MQDAASSSGRAHASARTAEFLRGVILAGLFALPFLALFVTPRLYFPYITGRTFAFRAIVELVFACWAGLALLTPRYRPRPSAILAGFCVVLVTMAAADGLGFDPGRSVLGNYTRMEGYSMLLHLCAVFLVAGTGLSSETLWQRYFAVSVAASVLVAAAGLLQRFGFLAAPWGVGRVDATFGNPAYLATYLLIHVFLAAWLALRTRWTWARLALGAVIALDLTVLWLTATRGAAVGLAAGILAAALLVLWRVRGRRALRWAAALGAALVLLGSLSVLAVRHHPLAASSTMLERLTAIGPADATVDVRLRIWSVAWEAFRERPVLGWGQENFAAAFDRHFDPVLAHDSEWVDRAHNLVLDWLVAGGAIGAAAYLGLFAVALWMAVPRRASGDGAENAVLAGLLIGYFVTTLFLFDGVLTYVLFVSVLAYLHARAVRMRAPGRPFALPSRLARVALPVCAIGLAALLWLDTRAVLACAALEHALLAAADAKPVAAGAQGSIASDPLTQRNAALALQRDWFLRAIAYRSFGTREAREQFALTATRLLSSGNDPWVRDNLAPPALDGIATLASRHRDMRDQLFLGDLLVALGRNEDAIPPFERALAMAPRRQSIYVMLAIADYRQGDTATARNLLRQAFDLDPTYDTVRLTFAASAIASGDEELGSRLLRERYGTALVPDDRIIAAYSAIGRFDTVAALWRIKVESEPGNASYRMQLVGALMRAGQAPEAMKELGKINPAMRRKAGAERAK